MSLKQKIEEDMKTYMRSKDKTALGAIRMLRSDIKNAEIDKGKDLEDADVISVISSAVKKRRDAADQYKSAGREDLMNKELEEIDVLNSYLPEQMSEEDLKAAVQEAVSGVDTSDKKNFGKVMQAVMAKTKGRADGKEVNRLVKEAFDGND